MLKTEQGRRRKKGEVELPGIMEPVRLPDPSREALVKTCISGKVSMLCCFTQLLSPEEKKTMGSCRKKFDFVEEGRVKYSNTEAKECILLFSQSIKKLCFTEKPDIGKGDIFKKKKS